MLIDANHTIGQRVKTYRKHLGLSQDELADRICSRQTISILENDQHIPSADILQKIAVRLGIPLHEIMKDHVRELEVKVQIDMIKVYVEAGEYIVAAPLIQELESREDLLEYQRRELTLAKADCLMRTAKAEQAVEELSDLQHRLEIGRETDDQFIAIVYEKLGTANYFLSNMANAHAHYLRAYQLTLRFTEFDLTAARIAYNLGMICRHMNHHLDAIEYLTKAESFFKKFHDPLRLAQTMLELGIAFGLRKDFERADNYLSESLTLYKSLNILNMATRVKQTYAIVVLSQRQPERSIQELQDCAMEYEKADDMARYAYTCACIAYQLLQHNRISEADRYLQLALQNVTEEDAKEDYRLTYVYQVKAMHLLEVKEYSACIEYAMKSSELFGKMGFVRESSNSLSLSAKSYSKQGLFQEAYDIAEKVNETLGCLQDGFALRMEV